MNYVNVSFLPRPHDLEFKHVDRLIFDINYVGYTKFRRKMWFNSKGYRHRENGPAEIWYDGGQWWFRYGKCHREDGPAIIRSRGRQYWWLNDIEYFEEDFNEELRRRHELRESKNLTNAP